ncbi:GNAT family N-acetyltransferase [Streptomyces lydicus]|uniref:GNAT family N-acetyltransferase n=1 Tax=Streptomyces lydicus TaxID=47763 RepID=UPI003792D48B
MTDFALLAAACDWQPGYRQRLIEAYRPTGLEGPAADELAATTMEHSGGWRAAAILDEDGHRIAPGRPRPDRAARQLHRPDRRTVDRPRHDAQGNHRRAAHAWARRWCAERGAGQVVVRLAAPDEIFAHYPVRGQTRIKAMTAPPTPPAGVTYRPMTAAEYPAWLAAGEQRYLADMVRAGSHTPEQASKKAEEDYRTLLPQGVATPDNTLLVLQADGEPIGNGWLRHGHLPEVTYGYSLVVHPQFRGRGHGRSAMAIGEQVTWDVGDRVVRFNVFGGNEVAMSVYTAVGYRVVEETRSRGLAAGVDG